MRHPAYHLRPNKTADRFAFIEAIRRLATLSGGGLSDYVYHGLGGPYLEDFRLLYEFCPDIRMVSLEKNEQTYERQKFHRPCSTLQLMNDDLSSFIARYDPGDSKSVFWLDYTDLSYSNFEEFKALLGTVTENSMIKVTLRSEPKDYRAHQGKDRADRFRAEFADVLSTPSANLPRKLEEFAYLLQEMLQVASEQALPPAATPLTFVPVSSFCYSDGTGMLTLTGIVCQNTRRRDVEQVFGDWPFANLTWDPPKLIDVPVLSTKERLHLQRLLPSATGKELRKALGYLIDDNCAKTEGALEQYADFHRYSPYLLRGMP